MCGIAGFIDPNTSFFDRQRATERMCDAMVHRGPDDQGFAANGPATLGMRRLAIFDPANGHQPIESGDGRYTLVFNGSIVNFRSLREELKAHWTFKTECDTEVLLAAFLRWGDDCLGRLRGMYAFAVWDAQEKALHLARDPFGIKPLYFHHLGERLVFASEINALIAGGIRSEIDPLAVAEYLAWFSVPAPRTIYRGIVSLRPGERAVFCRGRLEIKATWSFRGISDTSLKPCSSREEFHAELRARLEDTIRAHAVADVPVGAFLSGGLDSAVVVGLMSREIKGRLQTFSIGFDEKEFSESDAARQSAEHFGAQHHEHILTGREVAGGIETFISACDQPTGDGLNTYYVSKAARAGGMTVALSGLGGDELFGGYPSSRDLPRLARWLPWWRALPRPLRNAILQKLTTGDTRTRKLADFLRHSKDLHELASMQRRVYSEQGRRSLLGQAPLAELGGGLPHHPALAALRADLAESSPIAVASAWEFRTYMPDLLLRDSDIMSMRHSLELRVPFLDRPLIEWLWGQPDSYRFTPHRPKSALAEAMADMIPTGLRHRRKQGFTLPMSIWMNAELKPFLDHTFSDASVNRSGLFKRSTVQSRWREYHQSSDSRDWSRIWSLAVLIAFVNRSSTDVRSEAPSRTTVEIDEAKTKPLAMVEKTLPRPAARPLEARLKAPIQESTPVPTLVPHKFKGHILLMAPEIFSGGGGIQRMLQLYLKALSEVGNECNLGVRLLALNDVELDSSDLRRYANGKLQDWFVCRRDKRRFVREALRMSRGCERVICGHIGQLPVAWAAKRLNPRLSYYLVAHGVEVWRPFSYIERLALRGAKQIFCVSDYTRRELLKHCKLKDGRVVVVHNALDPFFHVNLGTPTSKCPPVILTVSRLTKADRYKGVEHLIAAMPTIRAAEPDAQLHIVGRGDDTAYLQQLAHRVGLYGKGISFLGYLTDQQLVEEFGRCRLFAMPSAKEGFGLVFLEAMAQGRPCIGARAGGIPEVVNSDTGILVEYGDVPGLAAGCLEGLRRPWDQQLIAEHINKFSFPKFRNQLASLLGTASLRSS